MKIRLSQLRQIIKEEIQRSQASNLQEFGYAQTYLKRRARPEVKAKPLPEPEPEKSYAMKLPLDPYSPNEDEDPITIGVPLTMLDEDDFKKFKVGDNIGNDPKIEKFDVTQVEAPTSVILGGYDKVAKWPIGYATFDVHQNARNWFISVTDNDDDEAFDKAIVTPSAVTTAIAAAKAAATATTTESIKRLRRLIRGYT